MPRSLDELSQHRFVAVRHPGSSTVAWHFRRASGRRFEWVPPAAIQVSDPEALVDLALAHAGIAQAGLHHVLPFLRSGRLKLELHGAHDSGEREIVLHYPHRQFLAPRVRVVVEALLAHFAQAADLHTTPAEAAVFASADQPASRRRNTRRSGSDTPGANA